MSPDQSKSTGRSRGLPPPTGRQSDVVFMDPSGATVVLGTAGAGKSLMAIHRAAHLSDPATDHSGPTLLVTFNKALVRYLQVWAGPVIGRVAVDNFSSWARTAAIRGRSLSGWTTFVQEGQGLEHLTRAAIESAWHDHPDAAVLRRAPRFFYDELAWIAGMGCADEDAYQAATRVGRGGGVNRGAERAAVWAVHEAYRAAIDSSEQYDDDWPGLTNRALAVVSSGEADFDYRHVVVDEAQDLSPQALRALSALVPDDGSLTLFADYAQQLYGNRLSWKQVGIPNPHVERFKENYRNSTAIARLAIAMASQPFFTDTDDLVVPTARTSPGDPPAIIDCSKVDEIQYVANRARAFAGIQRVGILVQTHEQLRAFKGMLGDAAVEVHGRQPVWHEGPGITLTTLHSAKGLEFGTVLLPHATASEYPGRDLVDAFGDDDARGRSARLLYVGLTRARSNLIITHVGPLTTLLPPETPQLTATGVAAA